MLYQHTQTGIVILIAFACAIILMLGISITAPTPLPIGAYIAMIAIALIALAIFTRLTVQVTNQNIEVHFGLGLFTRKFSLIEIDEIECVRNPWYYGWGIRLTPEGWMYNVSGLDAVQLQLASGKRFRIGTDEPQQLKSAIDRAIQAIAD